MMGKGRSDAQVTSQQARACVHDEGDLVSIGCPRSPQEPFSINKQNSWATNGVHEIQSQTLRCTLQATKI